MRLKMASTDYFDIGMKVEVTNHFHDKIQGEVTAFDTGKKMMMLKTERPSGLPTVRMINLEYVQNLRVLQEATEEPAPLPSINFAKVAHRTKTNTDEKQRKVNHVGVGVTPEAQRLFMHIAKTYDMARWEGKDIVVLDNVRIKEPYRHCESNGKHMDASTAIQRVQKVVDKYYHDDQASREPSVQRESS